MEIILGCDQCGLQLKESIKQYLTEQKMAVIDLGVHQPSDETLYYDTAIAVAKAVVDNEHRFGILCCGTGMGMAIIANKVKGAYAAVCENVRAAVNARAINNANILTFGEAVTTPTLAKEIIAAWLKTSFAEGKVGPDRAWYEQSMNDIAAIEKHV
jgi:RpiB/LacA/LacB family sugar-phosphate isomerase